MRARGFGTVEVIILLAVAAAGAAVTIGCYWAGKSAGRLEVQAKWDAAKIEAADTELRRQVETGEALLAEQARTEEALRAAQDYEREWRAARDEARRNERSLASCQRAPAVAARADSSREAAPASMAGPGIRPDRLDGARGDGAVRFHWRFVGLWDGRYTAPDGEPLFGAQAEFAAAPERADTPSPYGPDELLDVHEYNAAAHSECNRWVDDTMRQLEAAEAAWDRSQRKEGQ